MWTAIGSGSCHQLLGSINQFKCGDCPHLVCGIHWLLHDSKILLILAPSVSHLNESRKSNKYERNLAEISWRNKIATHHCFVLSESLNIEKRYSYRAMLNLEPVAPPATGCISRINNSSLVVHMWLCTCMRMVEMNCQC